MKPEILFEDRDIIVALKPRGIVSQASGGFEEDMVSLLKKHLGKDAYIGVIHRLDKPVYGVMVFAKNRRAAAVLSDELRQKRIVKVYEALAEGEPEEKCGILKDYLKKTENSKAWLNISRTVGEEAQGAKEALLKYEVISSRYENNRRISRLRIELITGRHHQIRLQCAAHGFPLFGDYKYNERLLKEVSEYDRVLSLAAIGLTFRHPVKKNVMNFNIKADF